MKKLEVTVPPQIKMDFYGAIPTQLQERKNKVIKGLEENEPFRQLLPLRNELIDLGEAYDKILVKISMGCKMLIPDRAETAKKLRAKLFNIANWCMLIADGNNALLRSTGFGIAGDPQPKGEFGPPTNLTATSSKSVGSGCIPVRIKRVKPAKSYQYEIALMTDGVAGPWQRYVLSYTKFVFAQLLPGRTYSIRVAAIDKHGTIAYSEPIRACAAL